MNAALNAGIMLLASFVVDGVIKAWDKMNLTVEEQTEKVNELKSSYEGLKSEYDTLSQKQDITDAEKRRLEYLERRLELDERILKAEQKQLFDEKTGTKFTDWFDKDNYNVQYAKETSIDRINTNPDNFAFLSRLYDKKMDDIKATQEQITEWTKYRDTVAEGSDEWNVYQSHIDDAQNRQTSAMKDLDDSANQMTVNLGKYADNIEYFEEQLASGDLSEEETSIAQAHLNNWQELYNSTERMIAEIQKLNGTYDYTNEHMSRSIRSISDNHGISDRDQYTQLEEYTRDFTDEQKQLWLEVTQGAKNATEAIEMYEAALSDAQQTANETPVSLSSSDFLNKFETQYKPALSAIQSSINQVMEATESGIELKVDSASAVAAITDIRNAVDDINNSEEIDFNIDTRSVDEFSDKLMNALDSEDLNAVKQAYTDFANDVVSSMQNMFGDINESNMQAAQKALESVGILNAEQIIAEKTGYSYEEYAAAKQAAANSGVDLNGSVEEVATQLEEEGLMATEDAQALMEYVIKKTAASGLAIDVSGAIAELAKEWEWLQELIDQWGRYNSVSQKGMKGWGNTNGTDALGAGMYTPSVVGDPIEVETEVDVDLKWPNLDSSARSAGSKAGKSFKDGLKEQLSDLDSVISGITGRIDDQISSINEQKSATLDSIDAQKEALEEAKDAAIEALEAQRDAELEAIEAEKDAINEKIKALDRQIQQKQDEIDAINEAAEARKRELDLQKAQYELERMQNQRTILQYSEDKGMHYVQDTSGIRDAKESVDDAKRQIEIANLENEKKLLEDQKNLLNEQIELLDERADKVNDFYDQEIEKVEKYYDQQIKNLEKQRKETESYFESITKNLENQKLKFQELTELLEKAELSAKLKQLGIDEEALLNGSEEEFEKLKNAYMDIVFKLNEGNDEVLNSLRELSGYDGTAPAMLEDSNTKLETMNTELGTANTEVGNVNSALDKTATTTGNVATNVSDVNTNIGETTGLVNAQKGAFDELKQTIDLIVEAINKKIQAIEAGQSTVATAVGSEMANFQLLINKILEVKEKLDEINTTISTMDRQPIDNLTNAFQLLYDKILPVSNLLGVGMEGEGAVSGIAGAIQSLNEISLEEGIIAQFTMLKEAIDSVTSAISGGGGESSEGEGSGSGSGSKGSQSGGKGSGDKGKGESGGGGNSLTGAIKEMGETAQEVIGEPDAEGDGTVIGEFGSMETAVNDVRDAIGTEGSEGGEGGSSGETDDTLVGSIEYLGDKTEEEMGESGGDGIIGRFEEFRDVIGEANDHVQSINKGLDEIDGKEVSCTIHVNIETSGGTGFTGSAQVLGSMNLNSATYNAQYKGNAHYEGTAEVTGDWGVKEGGTTLVGELGQELVVFPNGRFKTVGDNGAEFVNIPANSIVFNHLQTKELLSKGNIVGRGRALASGTALANGSTDGSWIGSDGHRYRELREGDNGWDLLQKFQPLVDKILKGEEELVSNAVFDGQKQMEQMVKTITNNTAISNITNNRNVQQPIIQGGIHITCPGVTSKEVAKQVGVELNNMFNGLHLEAMQQSMMR